MDGRSAVLVPRERTHFSTLYGGYPLAEEFLDHLASEDVDAIAIDDGERLHVFDLHQYRTGHRIGHAPYPMKRIATLEDAERSIDGDRRRIERRAAEWQWLTDEELRPSHSRYTRSEDDRSAHANADASARSPTREIRDDSVPSD